MGQKRAIYFLTASFIEDQTCLSKGSQGKEFSESLKAGKPRVFSGVVGMVDEKVCPFFS
jgi:hypothetical protein